MDNIMTDYEKFQRDLHRGAVFESGICHALARNHTGYYESYPYITGVGQPSGDGRLTVGTKQFNCEVKAEVNRYPNYFFETHGGGGRESALTEAAQKDFLWVHYNGHTDVLIVARASLLLPFVESHRGQSGICFKAGVGDGQRASGFVVPVSLITGQSWVKSYPNFSGSYLTGSYALSFS